MLEQVKKHIAISQMNGKRFENWKIIIALEPLDFYTVYLFRSGKYGINIEKNDCVYCDTLKSTVENLYDNAIKAHNNGFINI